MALEKLTPWAEKAYLSDEVWEQGWIYCNECGAPEYQYPEPDLQMYSDEGAIFCENCKHLACDSEAAAILKAVEIVEE